MRRVALFAVAALATAAGAVTQVAWQPLTAAPPQLSSAPRGEIDLALDHWRRLRSGGNYAFADYARFLNANPGWPGESTLRRSAELAIQPGESPALIIAFFAAQPPKTATGHARLAMALAASGRLSEALVEAREAWGSSGLAISDESILLGRFANSFTATDYDRRADRLLFDKQPGGALRMLASTSPSRRAAFAARIAMQTRSPGAESQYAAVAAQAASDAGLLMDRARYLRDGNNEQGARSLLAQPHQFAHRPADPERWYDMMLITAKGAAADRQWVTAYNIARQVDDAFPAGTDYTLKPLGVRDNYTSLTWLAGSIAIQRLSRPADAVGLFQRYSKGGRSLQVMTKGLYWAGRAAAAAGQPAPASGFFSQASNYPDQFYGQLALERLGRPVPPPLGLPSLLVTPEQRAAFDRKRLVRAVRLLGQQGRRQEQTLFVRALSEAIDTDPERVLASQLAGQIGRQDLAVWTARSARNSGTPFYFRSAYPLLPPGQGSPPLWSIVHGITRQESSFDRSAFSSAGALGMMQLMPATARQTAGKVGVGYDYGRLTADPGYNVMLGSAYFGRLLRLWDGNYPLAVASYNAGPGNVSKWVRAYGDPRQPGVDVVQWIEAIPFMETRGYVQRVLENTVVYDRLSPSASVQVAGPTRHISAYLGKTRAG